MRLYPIFIAGLFLSTPLLAEDTAPAQDMYTQKCSRCHKLPDAASRTLPQWQLIIEVMQQIMPLKGESPLSDAEKQLVLAHLKKNARQTSAEQQNPAEDIFTARCTLCHQRPEPDMLNPVQWKMLMKLMQQRMQQASVPQLNEQEFDLVLKYLEERARN